jgi:hypothetical protein
MTSSIRILVVTKLLDPIDLWTRLFAGSLEILEENEVFLRESVGSKALEQVQVLCPVSYGTGGITRWQYGGEERVRSGYDVCQSWCAASGLELKVFIMKKRLEVLTIPDIPVALPMIACSLTAAACRTALCTRHSKPQNLPQVAQQVVQESFQPFGEGRGRCLQRRAMKVRVGTP